MKKIELHTHTKYSTDSITSLHQIIKACLDKKIDALAITDHNQIEGALILERIAPFKIIIGEEIQTKDGEIIGLFLTKLISGGLSMKETIKRIREQKGLVYLPHPYDKTTRRTSINLQKIAEYINDVDLVEVYNGRSVLPWDNYQALKLAKNYNKIQVIGSDAHTIFEYGRNVIEVPDFSNAVEFRQSVKKGKFYRSPVLYWVFFITRWVKLFKKRPKKNFISKGRCDLCFGGSYQVIYKKRGLPKSEYFITDNSYGVHQQIVRCIDCDLLYAYPIEDNKSIVSRYQSFKDSDYELERNSRAENQARILKKINSFFPKKGKLLDIGCATGGFLEIAKKNGWDVSGVEPSKWAAEIANREYQLSVFQGVLEDAKFKGESFDVIVIFDVIEHVSSPRKLLSTIRKLLKKDGMLCVVTPNIGGFIPRLLGEKWWHIRPDHIFYFNTKTLSTLLFSEGFGIKVSSTYGWTFSYEYWISRFRDNLEFVYKIAKFVGTISWLNFITKRNYSIDFKDSLEVYCRKI